MEHQLAVDGPIQIGETVEIRGGEIDAIFLLDNGQGKITLFVIDWKRSLSNKILGTIQASMPGLRTFDRKLPKSGGSNFETVTNV